MPHAKKGNVKYLKRVMVAQKYAIEEIQELYSRFCFSKMFEVYRSISLNMRSLYRDGGTNANVSVTTENSIVSIMRSLRVKSKKAEKRMKPE